MVRSAYGARPKITSTSNSNQTYTSTDKAHQVIEKEKVDVRTGMQERHADWLQNVNMEQKNWVRSKKVQAVKEEPSKSLDQMPSKTVTFNNVLHSHHLQMVDPRPSEPNSYTQNVNVSTSDVVNKNQPHY